jgi:hypothetical protein
VHKDRATIYLNVYHNQKLFVLLQYCNESRKYDSEEHEPMNHHNITITLHCGFVVGRGSLRNHIIILMSRIKVSGLPALSLTKPRRNLEIA